MINKDDVSHEQQTMYDDNPIVRRGGNVSSSMSEHVSAVHVKQPSMYDGCMGNMGDHASVVEVIDRGGENNGGGGMVDLLQDAPLRTNDVLYTSVIPRV